MKLSAGGFDIHYNRPKKASVHDSDPHIRHTTKEEPQMSTDDKTERYTKAATTIIKTYFIMKMSDRILEKLLK